MPTARISERARTVLRELAEKDNESMQEIIDKALETYRRKRFLEESNKAYTALRDDPQAWQQEQKEREEWEITLGDGLEGD